MILTPITIDDLPALLHRFEHSLAGEDLARTVFRRIAASLDLVESDALSLSEDPRHHRQAVALCHRFHMETIDETPRAGFTWDGQAVRAGCEPSVIIHEVGHLQCASPDRRSVYDFGLGAGPETGRRAEADAAATVFGVERDQEEALASLQGILWEAALDQPAILAFIEQNWLEGGDRPENRAHFLKNLRILRHHGLIDEDGLPTERLREESSALRFYCV
ncbi:hypothetical protein [Telmatospirillum siberiense]|uniref:Uncharacterized protein n=1 Tax=Telmatospirillum siberiense TaxID=382514 RepID=A0A2N3Q1K0_9PROT|nr:hypothetical protein [Telmatospirillum siberiense]PKU26532.1 hypothetical protein CWS72_01430 [Telmatospirillum siberiense]